MNPYFNTFKIWIANSQVNATSKPYKQTLKHTRRIAWRWLFIYLVQPIALLMSVK